MSTPAGDNAFLHELELNIQTELTVAETSQPGEADVPVDQWLPDPETQRYEIRLRTLLGAVEALEGNPGPGTETGDERAVQVTRQHVADVLPRDSTTIL